ncbi:hypothetical protein H0H93_006296, partial [Arthromyces matolae]
EVRIDDYLQAYRATGRPPPPCPQIPSDAASRARSGLPPLFEPFKESQVTGTNTASNGTSMTQVPAEIVTDPSALPNTQAFKSSSFDGDVFESISLMPMYQFFSHEGRPLHLHSIHLLH